jgi:hypothetical protein
MLRSLARLFSRTFPVPPPPRPEPPFTESATFTHRIPLTLPDPPVLINRSTQTDPEDRVSPPPTLPPEKTETRKPRPPFCLDVSIPLDPPSTKSALDTVEKDAPSKVRYIFRDS